MWGGASARGALHQIGEQALDHGLAVVRKNYERSRSTTPEQVERLRELQRVGEKALSDDSEPAGEWAETELKQVYEV